MLLIDSLRAKRWLVLFVIYLRYLLGGAFVYAGFGKAMGGRFMPAGSLQLPPVGITIDVFFETLYRTGLWWQFLGWGQLLAGFFLMTQRWSTLGALLFLPVSLNIFVITLSMDFHATPVITGLLVAANLGLLAWDYQRVQTLILPNRTIDLPLRLTDDQLGTPHYWEALGGLLFITSLWFENRLDTLLWFGACFLEGLLGLLLYQTYRRRMQKERVFP